MTETLFERAAELDRAQRAVAVSKSGEGRVLMVLGPPGIGKTSVLKALSDDACAEGFAVLSAHGSEFEHGFPFALAQQLFAPALATTPLERSELLSGAARPAATVLGLEAAPGREVPGAGAQFVAIHNLYWLACNLAERAPLLLAIGDAQWSDTESLRWLAYLGKRLEGVPMMVAMAARESEPGTRWQDVEAVTRDTRADVIRPGPLSAAATERLCGERLGSPLDPGFVDACQRATGGNPFLLVEVLKTLVVERVRPTASEAERVRELGPQSVARAVLVRTARLGSGPLALAKALAVLGDDSELGLAAEIAGLKRSEAEEAADALAAADVLGTVIPFEFIHPLVRASVYEDLPKAERGAKHARAARALADRGASADRIARHLLVAPPLGEQWAVDGLRRAARDALARGSPDLASRYLNRALIEPPSPVDRPFIHQELGASEALAWNAEGAAKHLAEGIESLDELSEIATTRRGRALVLFHLGRVSEAIDELQGVIAEVEHPAPELRLGLEADLASMREMSTVEDPHAVRERLEGLADGLDGVGAAERVLLACLSHARMRECEPATEVIELATRALAAGGWAELSGGPGVIGLSQAAMTLVCADEFDNAERFVERELVSSRELGSPFLVGMLTYFLSEIALRRGAIQEAEAQARFALELAREHGFMVGVAVSTHVLLSALIERGETDRAWEELASGGLTGELPDLNTFAF